MLNSRKRSVSVSTGLDRAQLAAQLATHNAPSSGIMSALSRSSLFNKQREAVRREEKARALENIRSGKVTMLARGSGLSLQEMIVTNDVFRRSNPKLAT